MSIDVARLRRFAPLALFAVTVALGWVLLLSPVAADGTSVEDRIALLRQREAALQAMVTEPSPVVVAADPLAAFDTRVSAEDQTASVVERLARLASDARARNLVIETVEGANSGGGGAPPVAATYRPDPRFALFDRQVAYTTIRMSFESDYSSLGQLLWNFRDLPSIVEVRTLNVQARVSGSARTDGPVRTSMTLFAYSRAQAPGPVVTGEPVAEIIDPRTLAPVPDVSLDRTPEWPRNPFVSVRLAIATKPQDLPAPDVAEPDLVVASILYSSQRRLAIINGRIVRVGDRIGSAMILDIEPRAVIVESAGGGRQTIELRMPLGNVGVNSGRPSRQK